MEGRWEVDLRPAACPGITLVVGLAHGAAALAPWVAGCQPLVAAGLSAVTLLAWPAAFRAVPGPGARLSRLRLAGRRWLATLPDGVERPAEVLPGGRVLASFVFCQVAVAGQKLDWWLPAYAVPAAEFRRFKVALRCRQQADGAGLVDWNVSNHEEAARRGPRSRQAN